MRARQAARGTGLLIALVAALILAACDAGPTETAPSPAPEVQTPSPAASPEAAPSPTAPESTPSPAATAPAESEALAAYQAYWDTYFRANEDPPGATYEDLELVAAGAALETVRSSTFAYREAGRVFRRPPESVVEHRAEVIELSGDTARVRDCYIDDAWIETVATGERANEGAGTQLSTAEMVREGGAWKVSTLVVEETWEGVAGCAAG